MMLEETASVLAKCAALDQRTVGRADILAWHEIVGGLELPTALEAVHRWYAEHRERIMPSDVLKLAAEIGRERRAAAELERVRAAAAADLAAIEEGRTGAVSLRDRSAEIIAFVQSVRDVLPKGDPDALRYGRRHWRENRERLGRGAAEANPGYDPGALARLADMAPPPPTADPHLPPPPEDRS